MSSHALNELLSDEEIKFYEELFALYDNEDRGYIDVKRFIDFTKENMADSLGSDQQVGWPQK
jgi:Ca2+-binding EF-hand superfamily protein